jgi:hypothetical protein
MEITIREDKIRVDSDDNLIHHPLNGPYCFNNGRDMPSHGNLTFGGHNLAESTILEDVKVFVINFYGEPEHLADREAWADPLRAKILERWVSRDTVWYLSCIGNLVDAHNSAAKILKILSDDVFGAQTISSTVVQSEIPYGYGKGFLPRFFFEVPDHYLSQVVCQYWAAAIPIYPIEGYLMLPNKIHQFEMWDKKPRDDQLFREVLDQVECAFYTYPAEHRHLSFVTSKFDLDDVIEILRFSELQREVSQLRIDWDSYT